MRPPVHVRPVHDIRAIRSSPVAPHGQGMVRRQFLTVAALAGPEPKKRFGPPLPASPTLEHLTPIIARMRAAMLYIRPLIFLAMDIPGACSCPHAPKRPPSYITESV